MKESIKGLEKQWIQQAKDLTELRQRAAKQLEEDVARELKYLEIGAMDFKVGMNPKTGVSSQGLEEIEFLSAPNPVNH